MKALRCARSVARILASILFSLCMWLPAVLVRLSTPALPRLRYRVICRMMSVWGHGVAKIWGMRVRVEGEPPRAPFFLVCNHLGYADIVLVCAVTPAWFISKSEVARWPGIGPLTRTAHTVFIDRETRRDVHRMNRLVADLLRQGGGVGLFPEGTTSDGTTVLPFRPSLLQPAVELDMPVVPAAISYRTRPGDPPPRQWIAWFGDDAFGPHVFRLLGRRGFTATIRFGDDRPRAGNRKELARKAHAAVSGLLPTEPA